MSSEVITYACGHDEDTRIVGNRQRRASQARWLARGDCGACKRQQRDQARAAENAERSVESAEANQAAGLPELEGSPKQVAWAETLRANMFDELTREQTRYAKRLQFLTSLSAQSREKHERHMAHLAEILAVLPQIENAKWYIEHRHHTVVSLIAMKARGELQPPTKPQKETGFDLFGLNQLTFPPEETAGTDQDGKHLLRLVNSRWEGCTIAHPDSMTREAPDGTVTISFAGDWTIDINDGARTRTVSAADFHLDRVRRRDEPGERHFWEAPRYEEARWNEFDIPEGQVSEETVKGRRVAVVQMVCSRWEGLHFRHPVHLTRRHRTGFVTIRFPPVWGFNLLGGERMLRVSGREMYLDRTDPLPEPGESLAVEPKRWHAVTFHSSRVRRGKDAFWVRLVPSSTWPDARVYHPLRMCHRYRDGAVTWRFHEDWEFKIRMPDGGTVEASAAEFLAATTGWAGTEPAPGTYIRVPEELPVVEVEVPAELLDVSNTPDDET